MSVFVLDAVQLGLHVHVGNDVTTVKQDVGALKQEFGAVREDIGAVRDGIHVYKVRRYRSVFTSLYRRASNRFYAVEPGYQNQQK